MIINHMFYRYIAYWLAILLFPLSSIAQPLAVEQFDQQYLAWKAQQEAYDQRLAGSSTSVNAQTTTAKSESRQSTQTHNPAPSSALVIINLNQANEQQLQQLKGIGEKKARAIIEYRQQHGSFKQIEELKQVKGIGESTFLKNQAQLAL